MAATLRFDRFELRPDERLLLVDGRPAPLGARAFDLLVALVERRGALVGKAELLETVWPGLVVEEANIAVQVSMLRKLLGERAIATVPGRGYRFTLVPEGAAAPSRPAVAVLAFDELSGAPPGHTIGEGFADDLITELARNTGLTVIARHSSFAVQGRGLGAEAMARELRVRYLVEGSLRRVGDEMLVNVQLIDGDDGRHVWAQRYTFGAAAVYAVQGEIVARIATTLFSGIRAAETTTSLRRPPASLDAYELTLRGAAHERLQTRDGMIRGREELQRALAIDPGYAPAQIWLGYLDAADAVAGLSGAVGVADLGGAIDRIRRGIALDPGLALGYQALGFALGLTEALEEALVAAQRAVELGPGDADNLLFLSRAQLIVGRYDEALVHAERAIELNPMAPPLYLVQRARALYALDRFDDASRAARLASIAFPGSKVAALVGAAADVGRGALGEAEAWVAKLRGIDPGFTLASPIIAPYFARDPERRRLWLERLRRAGVAGPG